MNLRTNQNIYGSLLAALLFIGVVLACSSGDETEKANKLVNEGNAAIEEGKKFVATAKRRKTRCCKRL